MTFGEISNEMLIEAARSQHPIIFSISSPGSFQGLFTKDFQARTVIRDSADNYGVIFLGRGSPQDAKAVGDYLSLLNDFDGEYPGFEANLRLNPLELSASPGYRVNTHSFEVADKNFSFGLSLDYLCTSKGVKAYTSKIVIPSSKLMREVMQDTRFRGF